MKLLPLPLLLVVVSSCASLPRPGKPNMPDVNFRMRDFRLANGMRIIVEEDHASPLVGVFTTVGVGSSGDPAGREGLAHLLEHLAFRAKPTGTTRAWNQLEFAGVGGLNASTSFDNTVYYEIGSKDLLQQLLTIESARLLNPLAGIDQQTFDVEREVVRNELRQRGENEVGPAFAFLQEAVFPPSHHYSRPVVGTHQSLSAITLDDLKKFVATNYKPANMTMLILGDVDLATVHEQLLRALPMSLFQPLPPTKDPYPARVQGAVPELPAPPPTRLIRRQSTVASPELYVVWSLPRTMGSETVLLDFVRIAADRELFEAFLIDPDILSVNVFPIEGLEASMLVARVALRKGDHVDRSFEHVLDQLVKLWATGDAGREGFSTSEARATVAKEKAFSFMRNNAVMAMMLEAENLLARGSQRVVATHFTGDPLVYTRRLKALTDVSPSQVSHYAEQYLRRDRARAVLVEPFPAGSKDATPGTAGLAPASQDAVQLMPPEAVKALGRAAMASTNETVVHAGRDHLLETLPNGLKVVVHRRRNSLPVTAVELAFPVGTATSTNGAAQLGASIAQPRSHLYGRGGDYGINWRTDLRPDQSAILGVGATGNLPNMLAQLSERVGGMHVDSSVLDEFKRDVLDEFELAEGLPIAKGERALDDQLFQGHPFSRAGLVAQQRQLSVGEIDQWFERAWSPQGAVLTVAGDFDAEATLLAVKQWLGGWKAPKAPLVTPPFRPTPRPKTTVVVTSQPGASQAQLHLACLAEGTSPRDELGTQVLAKLLGTSLFEKIRGELGASYGISGRAQTMVGGTTRLDWQGAIENSRLPQALGAVFGLVTAMQKDALTDTAIGRARWEVARQATLEDATALATTRVLTHETLLQRTPEQTANRFEVLAGVDRPQLERSWETCRGSLVVSLVGDEARIHESLKAAGQE